MKKLKMLALVTSLVMLSTAASAQLPFLLSKTAVNPASSPTLITLHIFSDHSYTASGFGEIFGGTSTSAPCSDLHTIVASPVGNANFDDTTFPVTSDNLSEFGPAFTCMKFDIHLLANGNVYSSGNIQLFWDDASQTYLSANPDKVEIDVSKE